MIAGGFVKLSRDHNFLLLLICCINRDHFQALAFFQPLSLLLSCSFCFVLAAHLSRVICYPSMGLCSTAASHHCWPLPGWSRQLLLVKAALSFPLVFCNIENTVAWSPSQGEQAEVCSAGKVAQRKSLFPWRARQQLLLCI